MIRNRFPAVLRLRSKKRAAKLSPRRQLFDPLRVALGVATVFLLSVVMSIHFLPDKVSLEIGDRSPIEIRANRTATYIDTEATLGKRQLAAERVSRVYDRDTSAEARADHAVTEVFDRVRKVRSDDSLQTVKRKVEKLSSELGAILTQEHLRRMLISPPATLDNLQRETTRLVQSEMSVGIRSGTDDLEHARKDLESSSRRSVNTPADAAVVAAIGGQALRHNQTYNQSKTDQQRDLARRREPVVYSEVHLGDTVIRPNEVFSREHLDKCTALGLISPRVDFVTALSIFGIAAGMVALVGYYLRKWRPAIYAEPKMLVLLSMIVIVSVFVLRVFGPTLGIPLSGAQFGYLGMMSVVSAGMMITVMLDAPLAMLVTALLSVQSGLIMNHEIRFPVMTLISSLVGIYSVANIRDRSHLVKATIAVASANVLMVWALGGLLGDTMRELVPGTAWAIAAAAVAIAIFWFGVAVLEKPFGILTHVWLLELSASERPLLRELCVMAPGTYAHSIMVGNLAEAGAEAVGADTLFCRVASYYHDIGKIRRPHFFVENQRAENIHDRLNPSLSALVIASHVRDGLELADRHRLPEQIKEVIAEHHGTSLIRYFYHQAISEGANCSAKDPVLEQHFRYDGPKPRTRESGIIMLADSVEAAARCLERPSPARLQSLVETLIHDKLADGQLDDCDLNFKDIRLVEAAFVRILSAMLHGRIDYPDIPRSDAAAGLYRTEGNGGLYPQLPEAALENEAVAVSRAQSPR